jgi:hypothetical protein
MAKITMFLGKELVEDEADLKEPQSDGAILGQLLNRPKEQLITYLGACKNGKLEAMLDGKSYKVTELLSDGRFKMEPK